MLRTLCLTCCMVDRQPVELTHGRRDVIAHVETSEDSSSIVLSTLQIVQYCKRFTNEQHIAIIQCKRQQ